MARRPLTERLDDLLGAATAVFIARGYRRTQMADVAEALHLSPAALYRYVDSKEALFDLVVRAAASPEALPDAGPFPVPTPPPGATLAFLRATVQREGNIPALAVALARRPADDARAELEGIVRDLYRRIARDRRGIKLVERSALDWPELAAFWFGEVRAALLDQLARYLASRVAAGRLRPMPDPAAAARLIVEAVTFFAMHRHEDPYPTAMDEALAEGTVVDALVHASIRGGKP